MENNIELNYSDNIFEKIKQDIKSEIRDNRQIIQKANSIDNEIVKKHIDIDKLFEIIDSYNLNNNEKKEAKIKAVIYNGNPYITLNLCLQALCNKDIIILYYDDFMLGVNSVLISIIKNVLKEYKLEKILIAKEGAKKEEIEKLGKQISKIIVIGKSNFYQKLKINNKKYFPLNNGLLYCDNEKFEELKSAIFKYSMETQEELEFIYEEDIEDLIYMINENEFSNTVIILTENDEIKNKLNNNIFGKKVYINQNPYKNEIIEIYKYLE